MILAWMFVLIPLVLYVLAYVVETIFSFRRLSNKKPDGSYLDATWEATHTFLVVSVALFVGLFSKNLRDIASAAFLGIFMAAVAIGLRGVLYVYLFIVRSKEQRKRRDWADWTFALLHIAILAGVGVLLLQLVPKLFSIDLQPNTELIPWMWPGLILVLVLCVPPLLSLYRTRDK